MFTCDLCKFRKPFKNEFELKTHVRRVHEAPDLKCEHCGHKTKYKFKLAKHASACSRFPGNSLGGSDDGKCLTCSFCSSFQCKDRSVMIDHYARAHDMKIVEESLEFADTAAFLDWKKQTEAAGCFRFKRSNSYKTLNGETRAYRCFRDGHFKSRGKGQRMLKLKGSCKINGVCPCSLRVWTSSLTGAVKAAYVSRHAGHGADIGRMNLTKDEKQCIADKLSRGVPINVVLDSIRESMNGGEYARIHLTTRKDLLNIKDSFKISGP